MAAIHVPPNTQEKLQILANDAKFDLACACGQKGADSRKRSEQGSWIYPTTMADGRKTMLFKTLLSNHCTNDCRYCPLRRDRDPRRCTLSPEAAADTFMTYLRARIVSGLFLSSGVIDDPDITMERINRTARLVRRKGFRGYIHLKVIPGASDAAIEEALSLAKVVSINIEAPGEKHFQKLCGTKNYLDDVIRPLKRISELTAPGERFSRKRQTTQFVVGAAGESDREIVQYTAAAYQRLRMQRVYFSAYQKPLDETEPPILKLSNAGHNAGHDELTREHRLYQVDFLLRQYGFSEEEIPYDPEGNLSLTTDPKEAWAIAHPEIFPLDINRADREELLRVPGLGPVTVDRILKLRGNGNRVHRLNEIGRVGKLLRRAEPYLKFA
ncbi:MAG: radical SAM protein [Planctomycetia bacterium]|jgi:predicted DNA-binding helix-hairpin-helix protein